MIEVVGRTGVVASHPEFMAKWWKVRLDGEEALRNVYRSDLLALDEDVEAGGGAREAAEGAHEHVGQVQALGGHGGRARVISVIG